MRITLTLDVEKTDGPDCDNDQVEESVIQQIEELEIEVYGDDNEDGTLYVLQSVADSS